MLRLDAARCASVVARPQAGVGTLCELEEVAGVAVRRRGQGSLGREPLQCVLAQAF